MKIIYRSSLDLSYNRQKSSRRKTSSKRRMVCFAHVSQATPSAGVVKKIFASAFDVDCAQVGPDTWIVDSPEGCQSARCAASCLLVPQLNDMVAISWIDGQWWITAVLVAASRERAVLRISGARELTLQAPVLKLYGQQSCQVESPLFELDARQVELRAHTTRLTVSVLQVVARALTVMAQCINSFSEQLSSSSRVRTVQIDEVDSLVARHAVTKVETSSLQADQVLINARDTVRIDGERIMMS